MYLLCQIKFANQPFFLAPIKTDHLNAPLIIRPLKNGNFRSLRLSAKVSSCFSVNLQYRAAGHSGADRIVKDNLCMTQIIEVSVYRKTLDGIFF